MNELDSDPTIFRTCYAGILTAEECQQKLGAKAEVAEVRKATCATGEATEVLFRIRPGATDDGIDAARTPACAHCGDDLSRFDHDHYWNHPGLCCDCFDLSCGQDLDQLNAERAAKGKPPLPPGDPQMTAPPRYQSK